VYAAWETSGQVYFGKVDANAPSISKVIAAPGEGKERKHPVLAVNGRGDVLMAWTEGTGWQRGGALAWQVYDSQGRPTKENGRIPDGIPIWGLAAAVARNDGEFQIIH
jgi:hypothetical protein